MPQRSALDWWTQDSDPWQGSQYGSQFGPLPDPTPMQQYGTQFGLLPEAAWQYLSSFVPVDYDPRQTWAGAYPGGYSAAAPLSNAPIDESRFWRTPTPWDRFQQGVGGWLQNFTPGNLTDMSNDFFFNGPGSPILNLPRPPWEHR